MRRDDRAAGITKETIAMVAAFAMLLICASAARAQTDCAEGNGILDTAQPKDTTVPQLIQKIAEQENKVRDARMHYTFTQDVMVQTLNDKAVDGQFHEVATVSYENGKRKEVVSFAEQSTLRGLQLQADDFDDIRIFMPWLMTTDELPQYTLTYAGQQHVDDLDTYVFHVEPKKIEKNRRYYQGRIWVDTHDLQIVKLCGKSVPDVIHPKKHQFMDLRPSFVSYRQPVDGLWFPAYVRVDDTLHFRVESIHLREIIKLKDYKKAGSSAPKP